MSFYGDVMKRNKRLGVRSECYEKIEETEAAEESQQVQCRSSP